jgi:uncharacterized protein YdhG (YjbR/CyaY superfamily)
MKRTKSDPITPGGVDGYIARCPQEVQGRLHTIRDAIRDVAPNSIETLSYFQMPGYSYPGYDYNGMFAWFSFRKPDVRLHIRPPVIQEHKKGLAGYKATRAIVCFPADEEIPTALVKRLVRASLRVMRDKS